ncbi:hypothetical protein L0244_40175, partial [bacterium]|nr:hypothetical protein [bacterium]
CPNSDEVADYRWFSIQKIKHELEHFPEKYTAWFRIAFEETEFRQALHASLAQADRGEVISHEQAIKESKRWIKKATKFKNNV